MALCNGPYKHMTSLEYGFLKCRGKKETRIDTHLLPRRYKTVRASKDGDRVTSSHKVYSNKINKPLVFSLTSWCIILEKEKHLANKTLWVVRPTPLVFFFSFMGVVREFNFTKIKKELFGTVPLKLDIYFVFWMDMASMCRGQTILNF